RLIREKPGIGAKAIPLFFKVLFVDILAMNIFKCEYGRSAPEIVRTKGAKRAAKLLIVWGFIFAGASTVLTTVLTYSIPQGRPYYYPHDYIVLDVTHPARILGIISGILIIIGSLIWLSVRYKEANYRGVWDLIGADYLPVIVLLIGISGFVLQAALYAYSISPSDLATRAFLIFSIHFHAIPVAMFFILLFWTKADHIIYRIFWRIYEYADKSFAGEKTRLPPTTLHPLNKTGKEIKPGY
ncbi:MAG: hypothetical protein QXK90_04095, partial [Candidatus Parvarchaeota archaeon]